MKDRVDPYLDFRNFLYMIWRHLGLPDPTEVQYDIADYLQNSPKKIVIEAFRGIGKSYITAAYVCWRLYLDPQVKILVVSAGKERSDAFSIFVKSLINEIPLLHMLKADKSRGQRDSNVAFDVGPATPSGSPSVKSVGISGQMTGSRADVIIADDVEIPSNAATPDLRDKLAKLVQEFAAILKPDGKIIYLGTPQTEMSLYNTLESRGYQVRVWCARYPEPDEIKDYGSRLAPFILDRLETHKPRDPVDPKRFDAEDLLRRELEYGKTGFALQFMLNTKLSDLNKFPLKVSDLIIAPVSDKVPTEVRWTNNPLLKMSQLPNVAMAGQAYYAGDALSVPHLAPQASVMTIDPSGRGKDETGYAVAKMLNGNIFVPAAGGILGGYSDEALIALCHIAKDNKVNKVLVESNFGDGMFTSLLTPHMHRIYPVEIEEIRHSTQKELRIISALEPVLNQHRLIIDPKVIQNDYDSAMVNYSSDVAPQYMLFYQLTRISKDRGALKHDDRLEALAMAVQYFIESLSVDQQKAEDMRKQELWDKEIDLWRQEMEGHDHQPLNFHNRLKDKLLNTRKR